jgi:branched-subunit amino acid transport protein
MNETDAWTLGVIVLIAVNTMVTRSFFFIPNRSWPLPAWLQRGLRYAPIAALAAVITPEVVMTQDVWISTWQDARLFGVAASVAWFYLRRHNRYVTLETLLVGMAVYLPLRIGLGW